MTTNNDSGDSWSVKHIYQSLGPGLLMTAAAVGASHLVLSTRAGAMHGLGMLIFIFLAMGIKYPSYRFAPIYTNITGVSILEGFRRQGLWALVLFSVSAAGTLIIGMAGITLVSAAIAKTAFSLQATPTTISAYVLLITFVLLAIGRYHWLDLAMKLLMLVLTISTIAATIIVIPLIDWSFSAQLLPNNFEMPTILFLAALLGWMPAPLEVAVIYTLWTQAKAHDTGRRSTLKESSLDFHIGYISTLVLAICFLLLGTGVMHGSGVEFESSGAAFTAQLISLYEQTLGGWSRQIISIAALAVMYSTVITALDGHSRILANLILRFQRPEEPGQEREFHSRSTLYLFSMAIIGGGAMTMLLFLLKSFQLFVDIAATVSFLSTPIIAFLIYRSIMSKDIPDEQKPGRPMRIVSIVCIIGMASFALGYVLLRLNQ